MLRVLLAIVFFEIAAHLLPPAQAAGSELGLRVQADGTLRKAGTPFRGIGVNYYDIFTRTLADPARTNDSAGFAVLKAHGIPFARFSAGGYWPVDWGLYRTNRSEYFARLDAVVRNAEHHGIGLIPSCFWHLSTVPDLVGEPCNRWGDPESRTIAFMRQYTTELVTRYVASPVIWGWEFGNEYNLPADLPNAAEHRPPVVRLLGTPAQRSAADEVTHAQVRSALHEFARAVRLHDPQRALFSGNAFPRPSAWHQIQERTWTSDTPSQFAQMLAADNPSPIDTLTVRGYEPATDLARLDQALAVARSERKPLFVGEFGVSGPTTPAAEAQFRELLAAIETKEIPLAALWVFDFDGQATDWNVTATNPRRWQLEAIRDANRRLRPALPTP